MKRLLTLAALVAIAMSASAQFEKGSFSIQPKIGIGSAFITNMPDLRQDISDVGVPGVTGVIDLTRSVFPAFTAGAEVEYQVADKVGLTAGLTYSLEGGSWKSVHRGPLFIESPSYALGYLNLPIVANFYVVEGLALKAGVQFGFLTNANLRMKVEYNDPTNPANQISKRVKESIIDDARRFRCCIPVGLSYEFEDPHFVLDLRYHIDLTRINKDAEETGNLRNSTVLLTLGYKFNLND